MKYSTYSKIMLIDRIANNGIHEGNVPDVVGSSTMYYGGTWANDTSMPLNPLPDTLEPVGIDITSAVRSAHSQPGTRIAAMTLYNGNTLYVNFNVGDSSTYFLTDAASHILGAGRAEVGSSFPFSTLDRVVAMFGSGGGYYGLSAFSVWSTASTWCKAYDLNISATLSNYVYNYLVGQPVNINDPYVTLPENDNPGSGYGPYDYTSETDLPPALPSASAAQCGFVSLWNPTITELQGLASYLWTSGLFDINTWRHLFSNPMDCILSVGIIPFVPDRSNS